jgi:hypothetical protein
MSHVYIKKERGTSQFVYSTDEYMYEHTTHPTLPIEN